MKVTTKNIENYEVEVTIEFEAAELEKTKKQASKRLAERSNIPGFRKGKVPPQAILEQHWGKGAILDEAADILIQKGADSLIKDEKIFPVTTMKPEVITCEDGKDFVFKLTFTPYPEVKLGEYKGIEVEKVVDPVTDKEVDEQLEDLRYHHANMIDAPADATVADGDFITLDFEGSVDGKKFDGGSGKDYPLAIGSHDFIGDFEEQLIGAKIGEERTVKVTFPENYHIKDLADRPAVFECKINSIKHRELPELDDEFVKKVSKFETLDEFKADIRKNMEANAERRAIEKQHDDIIQKAVDNMTVDVPPVMIEERITQMIHEFDLQLQSQGMKLEFYLSASGMDMDQLRENYRERAKKNVYTDILLDEVSRVENIKVEAVELDYEVAVMAQMYRTTPKQIIKILRENKQINNLVANVRKRKAMQFVIDSSPSVKLSAEESDSKVAEATEEKVEETKTEEKPAEIKADDKKVEVEQNLFEDVETPEKETKKTPKTSKAPKTAKKTKDDK